MAKKYQPYDYQWPHIQKAEEYFLLKGKTRGKIISPCGTGKTHIGYYISQHMAVSSIVVAVPNLSLIRQTVELYKELDADSGLNTSYLCVCSDSTLNTQDEDSMDAEDFEYIKNIKGVISTTDKKKIKGYLIRNKDKRMVIFTTYHSAHTLTEVVKSLKMEIEFGILDEAHRTAGIEGKHFAHLLHDENINIKYRLFMTATERVVTKLEFDSKEDEPYLVGMDNPEYYGETIHTMSHAEAEKIGAICPYKVLLVEVRDYELEEAGALINIDYGNGARKTATTEDNLIAAIALGRAMEQIPDITRIVSFHSRLDRAEKFTEIQSKLATSRNDDNFKALHLRGSYSPKKREKILHQFRKAHTSSMSNVRCFTEGVNEVDLNCILFVDPRRGHVDITQIVGRSVRIAEGKDCSYIILPALVEEYDNIANLNELRFKAIRDVLVGLSFEDESIVDCLNNVEIISRKNTIPKARVSVITKENTWNPTVDVREMWDKVTARVTEHRSKVKRETFYSLVERVRELGFETQSEYNHAIKNPTENTAWENLPKNPEKKYASLWRGWPFFLYRADKYVHFDEFKEVVRASGVKNREEWIHYHLSNDLENVPRVPSAVYKKLFTNWEDILGFPPEYLPYKELVKEVRKHNFVQDEEYAQYLVDNQMKGWPLQPKHVYPQFENWLHFLQGIKC